MLAALDRNDYLSALKSQAIMKELKELQVETGAVETGVIEDYYTAAEAAQILDRSKSVITRKGTKLGGFKQDGCWLFPKSVIDEQLKKNANFNKRGRKSKAKIK